MTEYISSSPKETKSKAAQLAQQMPNGGVLCLHGDLGSGKTVFTKGFAHQLGIQEDSIKSPTYTLMREYKVGTKKLYHFDFYRIEALDDLTIHDLEELFSQKNRWIIIEWAERIEQILPPARTDIHFTFVDEQTRKLIINTY